MKCSFTVALVVVLSLVGRSQCVTVADFSSSSTFGCGPFTVNFTDESTDSGNSLNSWTWNFGDGGSSVLQNPTYTYEKPGTYNVTLTIASSKGCTDTETKNFYIQVIGPDVTFEADNLEGCNPSIINFKDKSSFGSPVTSWLWNFGDASTSVSQNPAHNYTSSGSFNVSLKVSDLDGCSRTYTRPNYITIHDVAKRTDEITACESYTWIDGITYKSSNNTAQHTIVGATSNGCDSIVTLDLTINKLPAIKTSLSGNTIKVDANGLNYQWLDCADNYSPIPGEDGQSFTADANGNYAAQITASGCVDTTKCVSIITVGVTENNFANKFQLYPNPTDGNFSIDLGENHAAVNLTVTNLSGKIIQSETYQKGQRLNFQLDAPEGLYLLIIETEEKKAVVKLQKL